MTDPTTGAGAAARPSQRRSRMAGGRETELKVRLAVEEKERLRVRAAEYGVTMSRLLVESALGEVSTRPERAALDGQLRDIRWLVGNVANNVNQLAHQANAGQQTPAVERLDRALAELSVLRERVESLVDRLS